jgi:hypothetical protein
MSEEQTFRDEQSLSPRLIRLRRKWGSAYERPSISVVLDEFKTYNVEVRCTEKDFETLQSDAFATTGLLLAPGTCSFNCRIRFESSLRPRHYDRLNRLGQFRLGNF